MMANSQCIVLLCLALSASMAAAAFQYGVGGSGAWTVPTDPNAMSYNKWAESKRFQIGDSILFKYAPDKDSVLQVDKAAYDVCNTSTYIKKYDDGTTVVTLDRSGLFYFISGVEQNCIRNESLVVRVMADRSGRGANPPAIPPAPEASSSPPSMQPSPPPSPEASSSPPSMQPSPPPTPASPPPSPEASSSSSSPPSPPPSESTGVSPSSAPSGEESRSPPPPNGASAKVVGFMGSLGGLLGWLFIL